jgi:DNA-binding XRE family transcriptional regulator
VVEKDVLPFRPSRIPGREEIAREREYLDGRERLALAHASTQMHEVIGRMQNYKKTQGLSDERFAREIDVSKTTIYRWRTGEVKPPYQLLALALAQLEQEQGLTWHPDRGSHTVEE